MIALRRPRMLTTGLMLFSTIAVPACRQSPPGARVQTYRLVGIVREIQAADGRVVIAHDEIPGFMPRMTMPFSLRDREILRRAPLSELRPGDKVEGTLRVEGDESDLVALRIIDRGATEKSADPAARADDPPVLRLDFSGAVPALRPQKAVLEPGDVVPDFTVTTQDDQRVKLSELRGNTVVLTFIYTRCPLPDFCPLMDRKFAALSRAISAVPGRAATVRLLSVSFDPEHDTPEVLRRHARSQGAVPPLWTFAVAQHDDLRKVAEPLGLIYGPMPNEIVHNLSTAIIDPEGKLVRLARGKSWTVEEFLKIIYTTARQRRVGS